MPKKIDNNKVNNKKSISLENKNMGRKALPRTKRSGSKTPKRVPKKRGRRPKKILDSNEYSNNNPEVDESSEEKEMASVICHMNINPDRLNKLKIKKKEIEKEKKSDSSDDLIDVFKNDIPKDSRCSTCAKHEKTIETMKSKLDKINGGETIVKEKSGVKIHNPDLKFISQTTGKKISLKKTNVKCFWDTNTFDSDPFPLVESFHEGTYYVLGTLFCSIQCALAHNLYILRDSKIHQRKSLTIKLYKEMYGIGPSEYINIKEAGPIEILEDYGGEYSIDTYRKKFLLNREYIKYLPPVKTINNVVEEQITGINIDDDGKKKYALKRSRPLNKKKTVTTSLNTKYIINNDDDEK